MTALLNKPRVDDRLDVGLLLDDADLEQEVRGFVRELLDLAGEEFLVRLAVLPAQELRRGAERLAGLLHVGAHDLVCRLLLEKKKKITPARHAGRRSRLAMRR